MYSRPFRPANPPASRRGCCVRHGPVNTDALWYKDAIVYQLHVKSFRDSNADGYGDFRGLIDRLDYVRALGANTALAGGRGVLDRHAPFGRAGGTVLL